MKWRSLTVCSLLAAMLALSVSTALATFNYEYGTDEYVTIGHGISPNRKFAITAHGEGDNGYGSFHLYLFDVESGKKIAILKEIVKPLDTGAGAFCAVWKEDSSAVTVIYRVSRHLPLKTMAYRLDKGIVVPMSKEPLDLPDDINLPLRQAWGKNDSTRPPEKIFGTPKPKHWDSTE